MSAISPSHIEDLIKTRRSIRKFARQPIPYDTLTKLVEAAIWAPNGCNQQELRFRILVSPDEIEVVNRLKPNIKNPQAMILVYADSQRAFYTQHKNPAHAKRLPYLDAGAAIQNLLLMAHSMGIASCWLNLSPAYAKIEQLYQKFPDDRRFEIVSAVALGYKDENVNVETTRHVGANIKRHDLDFYLLSTDKKILLLHYPIADVKEFPNLGSEAYSIGLRNLIKSCYPQSAIDWLEPPVRTLNFYHKNLPRNSSWPVFDSWVSQSLKRAKFFQYMEHRSKSSLDAVFNMLGKVHKRTANRDDIPSRLFEKYCVREGLFYYFERFKKIDQADLVILNGNGLICDLFWGDMWWLLFEAYLAKKLGKNVIAVNQTVDVTDPMGKDVLKNVYNRLDMVAVREQYSLQYLAQLGLEEPAPVLAPDCAFLVEPADENRIQAICRTEGITGEEIGLILRGDTDNDPQLWVDIVNDIQETFQREVLFVSTCARQDRPLADKIAQSAPLRQLQHLYSCHDMIGLYQKLPMIISERYHANVFAIIAGTPVLPLRGNTAKTHGLFRLFDYPLDVLDTVTQDNRRQVLKHIDYLLLNSGDIRDILAKASVDLQKQAERNISPTLNFWEEHDRFSQKEQPLQ